MNISAIKQNSSNLEIQLQRQIQSDVPQKVNTTGQTALIIGGGPTALASALELQSKGWKVTVLEKHPSPNRMQHAFHLTKTTLQFLKTHGLTETALDPYLSLYADGSGSMVIEEMEKIMEKKAREMGVKVLRGQELSSITAGDILNIKNRNLDLNYQLDGKNYDLIIGADGSKSTLKNQMKFPETHSSRAYAMRAVGDQPARAWDLHPHAPLQSQGLARQYVNGQNTYYNALISEEEYLKYKNDRQSLEAHAKRLMQLYAHQMSIKEADVMEISINHTSQIAKRHSSKGPIYLLAGDAVAQSNFVVETGFNTHVLALKALSNAIDLASQKVLPLATSIECIYQSDAHELYKAMQTRSRVAVQRSKI